MISTTYADCSTEQSHSRASLTHRCRPTCLVFLGYNDHAAAQRAMKVYFELFRCFEDDCEFSCRLWRFNELADASLCEFAIQDAVQADLIILAGGSDPDMPAPVKGWIESWSASKTGTKSALVWLPSRNGDGNGECDSLPAYLAGVAQETGMEFAVLGAETEAGVRWHWTGSTFCPVVTGSVPSGQPGIKVGEAGRTGAARSQWW